MTTSARPLLLLGGLCLALAGLVARAATDLASLPAEPPLALPVVPATTPAAFALPAPAAPATYQALLDLPPFSPGRGAQPEIAAAPEPVAVRPIKPVAVITSPERRLVLLAVEGAARLVRAEPGDEVEGWRIIAIEPAAVTLEDGDGAREVVRIRPPRGTGDQPAPVLEAAEPQPLGAPEALEPAPDPAPLEAEQPNEELPVWTPDALERLVLELPATDSAR
jgi:hypothetical protein